MAQQHALSGLIGIPFDAGEWWSPWLHPMPIEWPTDSLYKVKKVPNLLLNALNNAVYVNNWEVSAHRGETRAERYFCRPGRKYFCRPVSPRRGETCQHCKALNGLAPEYIADLLHEYVPTRALRSAGANLLLEPKTNSRWGAQAFSKAAPILWNTLPSTIKTAPSLASFKLGLKTYLFKAAFL